jgi:hypothetical protein
MRHPAVLGHPRSGGTFPWGKKRSSRWVVDADRGLDLGRDRTMAGLTKRTWRSWAGTTLAPLLERPTEWMAHRREWGVTDETLAATPTGWLAQGLVYSRTRSGDWFHAYAWVMPLYLRFPDVALSWSQELMSSAGTPGFACPSPETREAVAQELAQAFNRDGLPYFERVGGLEGFRDRAMEQQARVLAIQSRFWHAEEVGYTHLLLGHHAGAEEQLARQSVASDDSEPNWAIESRRRCAVVLELLHRDPDLAVAQLADWAEETAMTLGLTWQAAR